MTHDDAIVPHARRLWLYGFSLVLLALLALPSLIVVPMSFSGSSLLAFPPARWSTRWYEAIWQSAEWRWAAETSLLAGLGTAALATPMGVAAALAALRGPAWLAATVRGTLLLPFALPAILVAIAAYFALAALGVLNTLLGIVLVHTAMALPVVAFAMEAALRSFAFEQLLAARSMGAHPVRAFLTVAVPQLRQPIAACAILAFLASFDEVVVASFIAGGDRQTLTRRMFASLRNELDPGIAAIATLLIAATLLLLLLAWAGLRLGTPPARLPEHEAAS